MQDSAIGSTNRDYLTVVNQAAGVVGGLWEVRNTACSDRRSRETPSSSTAMDTTDPLMGTATVTMNFDAVDEIQLLAGGFEQSTGGPPAASSTSDQVGRQ